MTDPEWMEIESEKERYRSALEFILACKSLADAQDEARKALGAK